MTSLILAGLGLAGAAFAGRMVLQAMKHVNVNAIQQQLPKINASAFNSYYKGGFEPKMTRREAGLVLGISPSASKAKIREAHRRIMLVNHPDKGLVRICSSTMSPKFYILAIGSCANGGSPYIASKINEAKDILDGNTKSS